MYLGIDLAKQSLTATLLTDPKHLLFFGQTFPNNASGFQQLLCAGQSFGMTPQNCQIIMEVTGVYGEKLCHFFSRHQFRVYVEPGHFMRRAFRLKPKTDPIDSRMIAEYGFRFQDELHEWHAPDRLLEQIRVLLVNRELFVKERTAHKNVIKALQEKADPGLLHYHDTIVTFLKQQIVTIEQQIKAQLKQNALLLQQISNLCSIPGIKLLYAANFMIVTDGFHLVDYRNLASYLGVCPHAYASGTSVYKRPKSDKKGPDRMRKLLFLAAMSSTRQHGAFRQYFQRKKEEGKHGDLILNNIANKILRLSCAVVKSGHPYDPEYRSVHFTV